MLTPPPLISGSLIRVVAPSGPFEEELLRQGISRLSEFNVQVPEGMMGRRSGFFAGTDEERVLELQAALDCPTAGAILIARGGYGIARLMPKLNFTAFLTSPKWLIGFSDATVLHCKLSSLQVASVHGPNGTTLARASSEELNTLLHLLGGNLGPDVVGLSSICGGSASGPLFGGNLTVLFAEAAADRLEIPWGAILFLEDVTETSYRIDRMLNALTAAGHFDRCAGILLGDFHACSAGKFDVETADVLRRHFEGLGLPAATGFPIGHGPCNVPVLCGIQATLDAHLGTVHFGASTAHPGHIGVPG